MPLISSQPSRSLWSRGALAVASGLLLTATYPPFDLWIVGWIGLTPLLLALDGASPRVGVLLGWLTGTVLSLGVTGFWMFRAACDYFHLGMLGAAALTIGVNQIFVALYWALFGLIAALVARRYARAFVLSALYVATEYARAHLLSGNPWALLGHSQTGTLLIQICDLTGVYGLSFLLVLSSAAIAQIGQSRLPALLAALTVGLTLAYGAWRLDTLATTAPATLPIALVQGNLPNVQRGRPEFFSQHLERYLDLTRTTTAPPPVLIVWPENAIGFFPNENPPLLKHIVDQLRAEHGVLLAGAPRAGDRPGVAAIHNSAYLVTADGVDSVYDKRILLPFVERLPLRPDEGPYVAGTSATIFSVAATRFAVLICYEALYPELARESVTHGAQLLVNISNDSWFDAGAGPQQHYEMVRFRAVENRVSVVRVTNSGVSGVFDPAGREVMRLPAQTAIAASANVPIGSGGSFYTRHGDLFAASCIVASVIALLLRRLGHLAQ